jgi:hypothetical protein
MSKTAREIVDEALGIDAKEIERIGRFVDQIYPNRAPCIRDGIIDHARLLWRGGTDDATARDNVESVAKVKGAEFTRATPSAKDYVTFIEKQRADKWLGTDAETRMSALRKAQLMSADELVEAVPMEFTTAPVAAQNTTPVVGAANDLDSRIERAFGMVPGTLHSLPASKVREYRSAMQKIDTEGTPKQASAPPPAERPLTPAERIAQFRREQAAKAK